NEGTPPPSPARNIQIADRGPGIEYALVSRDHICRSQGEFLVLLFNRTGRFDGLTESKAGGIHLIVVSRRVSGPESVFVVVENHLHQTAIMSNKKRRQLIIVSHSAPIVVNGDAEYVISMQHDRTGLYPGLCGALQEAPMKALICRQMEGGEKAFRSRYERILS
ncbi:hypothetical protein P3S47_25585, partial [Enterobacter hormaechei]|uniref:hypothetical protein n=1 Tax=Enterobacter hormaechei TaxID=158836 RepID=UPI0023E357BD